MTTLETSEAPPQESDLHPDAFRLVTYHADDMSRIELIWNARNAAAPETIDITPQLGGRRASAGREPRVMDHLVMPGSLVLIACTEAWAWSDSEQRAAHLWETFSQSEREAYGTQADLEAAVLANNLNNVTRGYSRVAVADEAIAERFGWQRPAPTTPEPAPVVDARCKHDMLTRDCAICNGAEARMVATTTSDMTHGPAVAARYAGNCASCGATFGEGDPISYSSETQGWVGAGCCESG